MSAGAGAPAYRRQLPHGGSVTLARAAGPPEASSWELRFWERDGWCRGGVEGDAATIRAVLEQLTDLSVQVGAEGLP